MSAPNDERRRERRPYLIGFALALVLTALAFAVVRWPNFPIGATLAIVFGLALIQMVVHLRYFLHITLDKSSRDDLQLILFSAIIILLMVAGTIVLLFNLRARMM